MAPKKPNAFITFVFEQKKSKLRGLSFKEAVKAAGPMWERLTDAQKQVYVCKAKQIELLTSGPNDKQRKEPLNCYGKSIRLVEEETEEKERKIRVMKNAIGAKVHSSAKYGKLETASYLFISVNYFLCANETTYLPAEISLCEFSLKEGVKRVYHDFINPGFIMYGLQHEAEKHSGNTHKLPLPPNAKGEKDLSVVYENVLNFIKQDNADVFPTVYTTSELIPVVESVLEDLSAGCEDAKPVISVYSIEELLFVLKDETTQLGELERPASKYITDAYFERDSFEYQTGIACAFHEQVDRTNYCTMSCVIRWGYMFANLMCQDIAIEMVPGRHCPKNKKLSDSDGGPTTSKRLRQS